MEIVSGVYKFLCIVYDKESPGYQSGTDEDLIALSGPVLTMHSHSKQVQSYCIRFLNHVLRNTKIESGNLDSIKTTIIPVFGK